MRQKKARIFGHINGLLCFSIADSFAQKRILFGDISNIIEMIIIILLDHFNNLRRSSLYFVHSIT